jgi:hypothetical protein
MKIIEVTIDPAGKSTVETRGFQGEECKRASRSLELALGVRAGETLTAEYHVEPSIERRLENHR